MCDFLLGGEYDLWSIGCSIRPSALDLCRVACQDLFFTEDRRASETVSPASGPGEVEEWPAIGRQNGSQIQL